MRAIAGSILILAAVQFHGSPAASRPIGFCLLGMIALTGVGCLASDFAGQRRSPYARALLDRLSDWLLNGRNFLIKGTILGAIVGLAASLIFFGSSQVGRLAAMPGAFLGLLLGVALDAVSHRYQHRRPNEPAKSGETVEAVDPLAGDKWPPLVESHGWGLSLGISHAIPDWPEGSNPIERR
jgi:hypothetical protein